MMEPTEKHKVVHVKAILNDELVSLNSLSKDQCDVIPEAERTLHKKVWYYNPNGAVITPDADEEAYEALKIEKQALARTSFDKGEVVDALIELNQWATLKALMLDPANELMKDRWDTHGIIKLDDADVIGAIGAIGLDIDTVKLKIAGL